jgi:hypothetical protein
MAIKVSQATIDKIKKMGMTKALAGAKNANPEMREALTRMYGAKRVGAANPAKYSSADSARSANAPARYKTADAARAGSVVKIPTPKKPTGTSTSTQYATGRARGGVMTYSSPTSTTRTSNRKSSNAIQGSYLKQQNAAIKRVQAAEKAYNAAKKSGASNQAALLQKVKTTRAAVKAIKPTVVK